ncbi:MAG: CpsD/CapB family tyrosine-protein kinase [Planctomycetota bacterium]|jgi:capsular exopolysaccharide synthesis family protein
MIGEKGHDLTPEAELEDVGAVSNSTPEVEGLAPAVHSVDNEARESIEQLWGSIFFSTERPAPKSIVVTAAESGEGTTQIASALALNGSSAEHGLKIALVDFNFRNPRIARLFNVPADPGVIDVVTGNAQLNQVIMHTDYPRLDVIPAGDLSNVAMSSLQGDKVGNMIKKLTNGISNTGNYDHVIIDAPPINKYATVQAIAGFTDGVVLVVKAGVTRRESVAEAKKRVELAQGKIIGLVLNQRVFHIPGFLYNRL